MQLVGPTFNICEGLNMLCDVRCVKHSPQPVSTSVIVGDCDVSNNYRSADRLWTMLHTPHIAQHVQSLMYVEGRPY